MKTKALKFSKILMMLCLYSTSTSFAQTGGCAHCIEYSTNCDADVIIDFWCNGLQITNNASTTIPAKTLYCPTWQSTYPSQCNPCDMTVKFVSLGGAAIGAPNLLSISNPGPIAPDLSQVSTNCWDGVNLVNPMQPQLWFDGTIFWILW